MPLHLNKLHPFLNLPHLLQTNIPLLTQIKARTRSLPKLQLLIEELVVLLHMIIQLHHRGEIDGIAIGIRSAPRTLHDPVAASGAVHDDHGTGFEMLDLDGDAGDVVDVLVRLSNVQVDSPSCRLDDY